MDRHRRVSAALVWGLVAGVLATLVVMGVWECSIPANPFAPHLDDPKLAKGYSGRPWEFVSSWALCAVVGLFGGVAGGAWRYTRLE